MEEDANRSAHAQLVNTLEASGDSPVAKDGTVTIRLGTLLVAVIKTLDTQGRVDTSNAPDVRTDFHLVSAQQLERARTTYQLVHLAGLWMPVVWLLLVAAALLVAVSRRRALAWLALGSLVCAGALLLLVSLARREVIDRAATGESDLVGAVWDVVTAGLRNGAWLAVAAALVVLLLALTLGVLLGRFRRSLGPRLDVVEDQVRLGQRDVGITAEVHDHEVAQVVGVRARPRACESRRHRRGRRC